MELVQQVQVEVEITRYIHNKSISKSLEYKSETEMDPIQRRYYPLQNPWVLVF